MTNRITVAALGATLVLVLLTAGIALSATKKAKIKSIEHWTERNCDSDQFKYGETCRKYRALLQQTPPDQATPAASRPKKN